MEKNKVETNNASRYVVFVRVVCVCVCVRAVYSSNQRIHPHVDYTNSKTDT